MDKNIRATVIGRDKAISAICVEEFDPPTWHAKLFQSSAKRHAGESLPQKAACRRPNSDALAREREGVGLVACRAPCMTPIAPSPGGAFLFWNQPPRSELCRCGTLRNHSALYPSKLGPVAAGPFLSEPDLTEQLAPRPAGRGSATGRDLPQRGLAGRVVTNRPTPHLPPGSVPADTQRVKESPGRAGAR